MQALLLLCYRHNYSNNNIPSTPRHQSDSQVMSRTREDMKGGTTHNSAQVAAPRLVGGGVGYAMWKPQMNVHLQRIGAEGIHTTVMSELQWLDISARSAAWHNEQLTAALALVSKVDGVGDASSSSSSTSSSSSSSSSSSAGGPATVTQPTAEVKAARVIVSQTVERSRRVFGVIYSVLPDELRPQVEHIAQGWAYGLWHWLETKF
jgi:hypothetical protein